MSNKRGICLAFGGQGYDYLSDLEHATKIGQQGNRLVQELLQKVSQALQEECQYYEAQRTTAAALQSSGAQKNAGKPLGGDAAPKPWRYSRGLDVTSWFPVPVSPIRVDLDASTNDAEVERDELAPEQVDDETTRANETAPSAEQPIAESQVPPSWYLQSSPVSYPLIYLAQLTNYAAAADDDDATGVLGAPHEKLIRDQQISCGIGHSQGVMAAITVSMSPTADQLIENAVRIAKVMFWLGLRCFETFCFRIPKKQDEFVSPMLAIDGLTPEQVLKFVDKTQRQAKAAEDALREQKEKRERWGNRIRSSKSPPVSSTASLSTTKARDDNATEHLYISLLNGPKAAVVSGKPRVLSMLKNNIEKNCLSPGEEGNQSRVPFSSRKSVASASFLRVSAAFHCPLNAGAVEKVIHDLEQREPLVLTIARSSLQFPVFSTKDGSDLSSRVSEKSLMLELIEMQAIHELNLAKTLQYVPALTSYLFEFGPVGTSRIGATARMIGDIIEGSGAQVITVRPTTTASRKEDSTLENPVAEQQDQVTETQAAALFPQFPKVSRDHVLFANGAMDWSKQFAPKLSVRKSDGKVVLSTKFSRFVGKPPVIMTGMTPTTSYNGVDLVAACGNAGFHGELAAGGLPTPVHFEEKVLELNAKQNPGVGIIINMLYLNAYQWGFQFPMVQKMCREGIPIESITIGAGVPSPEKASEIVDALVACGITYMAFKPGSSRAIHAVLEIARNRPDFTFILQWTGGRGGGHHSGEDFHEPLLETYGDIRSVSNVILTVGSGFGDAKGTMPYMTGSWSTKFGRAPMPVDAVLVGSRCMVAAEAATSPGVKELIVQASGTSNEDWEKTYTREGAGGTISVLSELGEPIHKIYNKGMACWREFDEKYFSLKQGSPEQEAVILKDKDYIIKRLNEAFQKVYFGQKQDGSIADLENMTYAEVLRRLIALMYVTGGGDPAGRFAPDRWIDIGYQKRTFMMLERIERRFRDSDEKSNVLATNPNVLDQNPTTFIDSFIQQYPETNTTLMSDEDVSFFIRICQNLANGKPVNFVPVIDESLAFWFKKDSLWMSEQVDCVVDRDPQRVCILHGPVAAKFSTRVDEPISSILGSIHDGHVQEFQSAGIKPTPMESFAVTRNESLLSTFQQMANNDTEDDDVAAQQATLAQVLATPSAEWLSNVLACDKVLHGTSWEKNPITNAIRARRGHRYNVVAATDSEISALQLINIHTNAVVVELGFNVGSSVVSLSLFDRCPRTPEDPERTEKLVVSFIYRPDMSFACLFESSSKGDNKVPSHNLSVASYYQRIWLDKTAIMPCSVKDTFTGSFQVTQEDIVAFNTAIGRVDDFHANNRDPDAPTLDFATVAGWRPLIQALFAEEVAGDILKLVHMTHEYKILASGNSDETAVGLKVGQTVRTTAQVCGIQILPSGKQITVKAILHVPMEGSTTPTIPWVEIQSSFLIRGSFSFTETNFEKREDHFQATLVDNTVAHALSNQSWFTQKPDVKPVAKGDFLRFKLNVFESRSSAQEFEIVECTGEVLRKIVESTDPENQWQVVGEVQFSETEGGLAANPVTEYLHNIGEPTAKGTLFENGGYNLLETPHVQATPTDCSEYASASRDLNPIHRNPYFAEYAELPNGSPIVHGMWTAALARGVLEDAMLPLAGEIRQFGVEFQGMVFPGEELVTQLVHEGVIDGRWVVRIRVCKAGSGEQVLLGRAEVDQPQTAYLFTGQGSAVVGMGMDRYQKSGVARQVWDVADEYFKQTYGFSILDIVQNNPKELKIFFGGPKGKRIRDNYIAMTAHDPKTGKEQQLIQEIRPATKSFTFKSPDGLLFATQFSQPALVLVQKAAFEELRSGGYVPKDSMFAGHSLGEYAALASFASVLSIEALVETVFLRGMVMQNAVERDSAGRSDYGMIAANPMRVGRGFDHHKLSDIVDGLFELSGGKLVQIVNYNVRNFQYVIAGELVMLDALSTVLTAVRTHLSQGVVPSDAQVKEFIESALKSSEKRKRTVVKQGRQFKLERGSATIPLPGIDVPFHSRKLLGGVSSFRRLLEPRMSLQKVADALDTLLNKFVPNVVAEPFSLERGYVEQVYSLTHSDALRKMLDSTSPAFESLSAAHKAHTLLIELLAHQFAMPVQWIDTQDVFFMGGVQRVIEMGPAPTLTNMAKQTFKTNVYNDSDDYSVEILWLGGNEDDIFFNVEHNGPSAAEYAAELQSGSSLSETAGSPAAVASTQEKVEASVVEKPVGPVAVAVPKPIAPPSSGSGPAPDCPPTGAHALKVIIANKLSISLTDVADGVTIKDLSKGRSAIQNELVGDLNAEFGNNAIPEGAAEMPLSAVGEKVNVGYTSLGKFTTAAIAKMLSSRMPGGFGVGAVKDYLASEKQLPTSSIDSVLLHGLSMQPSARLGSTDEAKAWLGDVITSFGKFAGVSMAGAPAPTSGGFDPSAMMMMMGGGGGGGGAMTPVPDAPVDATHALKCLIMLKLNKKSLAEVPDSETIKSLSGGRSAIQNEVVGDLITEFKASADAGEGVAELPLSELGAKFSATYSDMGKITTGAVNKLIAQKFPGGFSSVSAVRDYLQEVRMLGPQRSSSVLLHALTMQPESRFGDADSAKAWLDSVADSYAAMAGITIPHTVNGTGGNAAGGAMSFGGGGGVISEATINKAMKKHRDALARFFKNSLNACAEFLEEDDPTGDAGHEGHVHQSVLLAGDEARAKVEAELDELHAELGDDFCEQILPQHDAKKIRVYDSYWNWVIQDAMELHNHVLAKVHQVMGRNVTVPNEDNLHYNSMASWIIAPEADINTGEPPRAWFRNFLSNRATPELLKAVKYMAKSNFKVGHMEYAQAITLLAEQIEEWVDRVPIYSAHYIITDKPEVKVDDVGAVQYEESLRAGCQSPEQYVKEMSRGVEYAQSSLMNVENPSQSVVLTAKDGPFDFQEGGLDEQADNTSSDLVDDDASELSSRGYSHVGEDTLPSGTKLDAMRKSVVPRAADENVKEASRQVAKPEYDNIQVAKQIPHVHLRSRSSIDRTMRVYDQSLTSKYLSCMHEIATSGVSFAGQVALVTGAGDGSIGIEIVKALLEGGATVVVAFRIKRSEEQLENMYALYRGIYEEFGSKDSKLVLEPCNCSSAQDTQNLVNHVYNDLGYDLDFLIPFAAASENGRDISNIDSKSEVAHRMMLTNLVRLLGAVKTAKEQRGIETRPAMVLLPCSPNHGVFGNDGLYAESKLGCESLMDKWESEGWANYLSLAAAVIGWTRSRLMWQNNIVAPGVEERGCRTFHTTEMAFNLVSLLHPYMTTLAAESPIWADLTGNWHKIQDIKGTTIKLRKDIMEKAQLRKALVSSKASIGGSAKGTAGAARPPLANPVKMYSKFPNLPDAETLPEWPTMQAQLQGAVDLRRVVVVTGFGEVGPWGNSRTRWEMEAYGMFSMEGCIELAWLLGLIKPHNGPLATNPKVFHIGWVDASSNEPVQDHEVKAKYEETMLKHCGVRVVEPELFEGYDPQQKKMLHYVAIDSNMRPIEVSSHEEALQIQRELGMENAELFSNSSGNWFVKLRKGAVLAVPRALRFDRFVAGQIPTGWDAQRLGVPADIADSVDPITLYALVATVEAFVTSGVTDPYEMYQYVHLTEVGNTSGSGMGGMRALKRMFFDRKVETEIPSDTLAESFINTMPAWINMLLLSSCGPIKTPVGACATAAESVEIAVDTIVSGKARVIIAGGYDDFGETGSYEFAQMGATCNSEEDAARGRFPKEASRPMTESRNGFVESQGSGIQLLMDAELAVEMGVPIYGIVALTNTATDKEGRSIPAPGQGILTTAREVNDGTASGLLDFKFRKTNLDADLAEVSRWEASQLAALETAERDGVSSKSDTSDPSAFMEASTDRSAEVSMRTEMIRSVASKKRAGVYETWGQGFFKNLNNISPLRGALAVWGLTVDDIKVGSFHGTSTKLNDKNESGVVNTQMQHLGRSEGNHMLVVAQKYLTGHPKGAACAWMLNGMLQCLNEGLVPGNRNLDNVSPELRKFGYLFYPNRSQRLPFIKAALIKSFGFGQAGAEILVVHPHHLLACLTQEQLDRYTSLRRNREDSAFRYQQGVLSGKHTLVQVKSAPPYSEEQQETIYLDPSARAVYDDAMGTWAFQSQPTTPGAIVAPVPGEARPTGTSPTSSHSVESTDSFVKIPTKLRTDANQRLQLTVEECARGLVTETATEGLGTDMESVSTFADLSSKQVFIDRNFTSEEQKYCMSAANPSATFAGRWAAKEAVIKAISNSAPNTRNLWKGADAPLDGIEVLTSSSGAPVVSLHGHALEVFNALGLKTVKVSISHCDGKVVAQALVK